MIVCPKELKVKAEKSKNKIGFILVVLSET
jgi:hypothetical protein